MKAPQFSTWSSFKEMTNGGSVIGGFPGSGEVGTPLALHRPPVVGGSFPGGVSGDGVSPAVGAANGVAREESESETFDVEGVAISVPLWKRAFDLIGILLTLPISLPLGLVIMGWIKLVSPGPVFYRQARIGRGGKIFTILKFRSMKVDAPTSTHEQHLEKLIKGDAPMTKLDGVADPRIIPGGRCLRAIGLDELPQLINVFRGEMSLVGPRPSTVKEHAMFTDEQKGRAAVLPGLTGYWQVSGKNKLTFQQMIYLDLQYVRKMSPGLDLAIVVATIPALFLQYMESRILSARLTAGGETDQGAQAS
jgi:lipopolysaccharide/colanic/teichoic acid biosynthesis glycosyltransferase